MKTGAILGGILVTGVTLGVASVAVGAGSKARHNNKLRKIASSYNIPQDLNYKTTMDSLIAKAKNEKIYLESLESLKKYSAKGYSI